MMSDLMNLPNIGSKLAAELLKVGIDTPEMLVALGSVETMLRITRERPHTGYNLLYALEGAIRGVRWHSLPRKELIHLRTEYDRRRLKF
jgi:DNA transformation protein